MTLQEESRLSYYKKIAGISTHENIVLVQHTETKKIYVRKDLTVYDRNIYLDLQAHTSRFFPQIYECVESDGKLILIEEYIQGQSLEEYFGERGALPESEVRSLAAEICSALCLLHERMVPVIHRDLKPSNILLTSDGQIKIVDFNIARSYDDGQGSDTVVMGTRKYAAPEQYGYAQTDARTDIYAMGVMMNYLLTGKYPSEEIFSGRIGAVIRKCIEFDPDRRYQSVAELQEDLLAAESVRKGAFAGETNEKRTRHPFLPPGFRTGIGWKMLVAVIGYVLLWYFGLTLEVGGENGIPLIGAALAVNRISFIGMGMLWIFFWFDYLNVHRFLPLMKRRGWKIVGYVLYTFLIMMVILLILTGIENIM
ncbi:MAG: serine/threonine protein kinase [Clostridiales bacterium]|nr:serine/threonine protein kinase [Clostridiales bacterium]